MRLQILQPEMKKSPVAWCERSSAAAEDVKSESKGEKHDHWLLSNPPILLNVFADRSTFQPALRWQVFFLLVTAWLQMVGALRIISDGLQGIDHVTIIFNPQKEEKIHFPTCWHFFHETTHSIAAALDLLTQFLSCLNSAVEMHNTFIFPPINTMNNPQVW